MKAVKKLNAPCDMIMPVANKMCELRARNSAGIWLQESIMILAKILPRRFARIQIDFRKNLCYIVYECTIIQDCRKDSFS